MKTPEQVLKSESFFKGLKDALENPDANSGLADGDEEWKNQISQIEARQNQERCQRRFNESGCPVRQSQPSGTIQRDNEWGKTELKIKSKLGSGFIIALIGTRGEGKTQMAVELVRQVCIEHGQIALYVSAMSFFRELRATFKSKDQSEEEVIEKYSKCSLLVIDEAGKRSDTQWENLNLFDLIDKRYGARLDTLLISNQSREQFAEAIDPSLASRMQETGGIIQCNWKSFREKTA